MVHPTSAYPALWMLDMEYNIQDEVNRVGQLATIEALMVFRMPNNSDNLLRQLRWNNNSILCKHPGRLGNEIEHRGGETFGNAEQGESRMKTSAFHQTSFSRCEKSGHNGHLIAAQKENLDRTPTANLVGGFFVAAQGTFF